ncbi:acetylglutamate kinase [Eggerthellaceae bacterium zg-1084]|uniref:Acetylglutamate kinase n=1 Tax=Berryella wangjianweii TaxID=2734634 RepID=A0A6M8IXJ7_9ACTN|nr:acetylglutamate kinase [Berryella wangjianweii]NPD31017.1 acetylglutamate kinase [Berryella wangjianweii]NPD31879.1 acetylglutamate kinase [Eggerthellaceae bacterium zg-997]QKF07525.1 acetylglutamate kinase [Berryella wangjianweii]
MQFARKQQQELRAGSEMAAMLAEATPWIKTATGKTVVIKYGGSAMVDERIRQEVMNDIVLLKLIGLNPAIIHGGGNAISDMMGRLDIPVEFKGGLRVTGDEAMDVTRMVLTGQVNQDLVRDLNRHGNLAVGVSGADGGTIIAKQMSPDLGRVGRIATINAGFVNEVIAADYIPVIASVALGTDGGYYNINADMVAGDIAAAIGAHKVIFLTDVDGLYRDFSDKDSLISDLTVDEAEEMIQSGSLATGMIPKLRSCVAALRAGVPRAHIVNGTTPHALLLELLTDAGVGTVITPTQADESYEAHPLGNFASKLNENYASSDDRVRSIWNRE